MSGFSAPAARADERPVAVFDLGGTWFRAGVLTGDGTVTGLRRAPATGSRTGPGTAADLQRRIVDWLVRTADEIRDARPEPVDTCAVSLGAAMNHRTGEVFGAAPLFGPVRTSWRPADELAARRPDVRWTVINDVSALAYALLADDSLGRRGSAAAVTVSTGIAYRTVDLATGRVPVDRTYGLQGEIGHLPAQLAWEGRALTLPCDCGADDHVSSYSSGRGIEQLLHRLPADAWGGTEVAERTGVLAAFSGAVASGHPGALRVLDAVTEPLARVLLTQACLNPEVERTVLTGGVVDSLGDAYLASLLGHLDRLGLYGMSDRDPAYFAGRIVRGRSDGLNALRGAGFHARGISDGRVRPA
ncbi:ROK family protein [Streptomyces sp. NPDC020731]|uniref:ROK family protein n=1 Tax=Streptomyces sp. NPDC020731 TaxID=3365085 RepID=UPI00379A7AB7